MKIYYFTGTGNSFYIARQLSDEIISIPQVLKSKDFNLGDEDTVGFVFPTYGANAPKIVKEFFKTIKIKSKYTFILMTCYDDNAGAVNYMSKKLSNFNIKVDYENIVYMPTNHIPFANLETDVHIKNDIEEQIERIKNDIMNKKKYKTKSNVKYFFKRNIVRGVHKILPMDRPSKFTVTNMCIKCNICVHVCPRKNVSNEANQIVIKKKCEYCLSCVHNCPKKAITVKGDKSPNIRYRNENVTVNEIRKSNNQHN